MTDRMKTILLPNCAMCGEEFTSTEDFAEHYASNPSHYVPKGTIFTGQIQVALDLIVNVCPHCGLDLRPVDEVMREQREQAGVSNEGD